MTQTDLKREKRIGIMFLFLDGKVYNVHHWSQREDIFR